MSDGLRADPQEGTEQVARSAETAETRGRLADVVGKLVAAPRRGGVRLTQNDAAFVLAALRERDEVGPFFVRDCARVAGLPDDAPMDAIMARIRAAFVADHPLALASGADPGVVAELRAEMRRQDHKHGRFQGTPLGRSRLALACLRDEVDEAEQAWRDERKTDGWPETRTEVLQVAAVALRALRDAFDVGGDQ